MIELKINDRVIRKLRTTGFYPDNAISSLFTLLALKENYVPYLDAIEDDAYSKRAAFIYFDLQRKGLIEEKEGNEVSVYSLTERGLNFLQDIQGLLPENKIEGAESFIDEWLELWPKGVKSGSKLVRSDKKSCLIKMNKFLKENPDYDKDTIMAVTRDYTSDMTDEMTYKLAAIYFISHKDKGSELATLCQDYKGGGGAPVEESFIYNNGLI